MQIREVQGRKTHMLDIVFMNLQGNVLPYTLWSEYADELQAHIERNDGPIVLIIQFGRIRKFRGDIGVSNTFKVSKVIYDENVREIEEVQQALVLEGNINIPVAMTTPSTLSIREELERSRHNILTVDRLIRAHEIDHYWIFCKIVGIEPMLEWCYVSCTNCYKKMAPIGASFYCVNCVRSDQVGDLRYKVLVRVADSWGIASLLLCDKECQYLVGKTVEELRAEQRVGQNVPVGLARIIGFKGLFKVNKKDFSTGVNLGPYPVFKITSDMHLIAQFCSLDNISEVVSRDNFTDTGLIVKGFGLMKKMKMK